MKHLEYFRKIGAEPLGNRRQAWDGEMKDGTRVLVLWADQCVGGSKYQALRREKVRQRGTGPIHRLRSLERHMTHNIPLLAILADAVDPTQRVRTVKRAHEPLYRVTEVSRDGSHWYVRITPEVAP